MKVYLATSGEPGEYGYQVFGVFARESDAKAFTLADRVEPFELWDGPIEVRDRHVVTWFDSVWYAPERSSYQRAFAGAGDSEAVHGWRTVFETWDADRAADRHNQWREAHHQRAVTYVAALARIDVLVWYEPGDRHVLLLTPLHTSKTALSVPRALITEQAGLPEDATLHGLWFSVAALTFDSVDGFSVCADPDKAALAEAQMRAVV